MAAKNPTLDSLRAAPGRKKLSVIVTTFNEEINVAECLESVLWADEILLVDSFSTDRTVEIARTFPITVLQRQYFGSAAQKNWALDRVQHEWVLPVDAAARAQRTREPALASELGGSDRPRVVVLEPDRGRFTTVAGDLERQGFLAVRAPDSEEGRRMVRELRPAVVAIDIFPARLEAWASLRPCRQKVFRRLL